jgi:hypothetical protein
MIALQGNIIPLFLIITILVLVLSVMPVDMRCIAVYLLARIVQMEGIMTQSP